MPSGFGGGNSACDWLYPEVAQYGRFSTLALLGHWISEGHPRTMAHLLIDFQPSLLSWTWEDISRVQRRCPSPLQSFRRRIFTTDSTAETQGGQVVPSHLLTDQPAHQHHQPCLPEDISQLSPGCLVHAMELPPWLLREGIS